MMTAKLWMDQDDLQPEHFFKALQKVEMEKAVSLFGLVEMVEEIMITVIVMVTQTLHGHFL